MQKVFQYIEDHADMYIDWLIEACNQPSVSAQNRGMTDMKEVLKKFLGNIGADVEELATKGYPIIYGELGQGKAKTLTFYNHYDVQPEDPLDQWLSEPFKAEIRDGRIFARGSADNKGNLMARICAIHAYQQVIGELPINVKFVFEGEEEVGSPHLEFFANEHPDKLQTDGIIWEGGTRGAEDKRLHVGLGVKGICYVELICKGAKNDLHSSEAAIIENPAWRLIWALATLKNEQEEILIKGFYDDIASLSETDKKIIGTMAYDEEAIKKLYAINGFLKDVSGDALKERLTAEPTCTICGIESGYTGEGSKTVLPSLAKVKLDFRLVPYQTPDKIAKLLRDHLEQNGFEDIEIIPSHGGYPFNTNPNDPFVKVVLQSVDDVYEEPPVILRNLAGSSPMYKMLRGTNIPAVQIGVANSQSNYHAPNENIFIDDYIQGIKVTAAVIKNFNNYLYNQRSEIL
ncbi:Acetylornithine deacetylase/Succinyl-diaminopimelate desuccinylase [Fictibacillus solisalsi]|uniref:Acetylornithine deacetylase/Succinyl-diaminopimelate desuccinylase n=1 Tax=Fictibacillus solisalsi TaxID=459525 RepID=A0A1G9V2X9_9BACL|nr:M20/M25/M40 family metallo-hydrolase [Fictibacillus solisalsi]SDM66450.1 Acetylornithine deacetylase/Succinyl-diaminopimelate desuccinylase [Fictibacillus solisalsi]